MLDTATLLSADERLAITHKMIEVYNALDTTAVLGAMDIVFGECDR